MLPSLADVRGGQLLGREPLVWAVARESDADGIEPIPLAIFAPGCIYRDAALKALDDSGRYWRHAYNSASREGLDIAVSAGFAVTIVPSNACKPNWRTLDAKDGFPPLPDMDVLMYLQERKLSIAVKALADILTETMNQGLTHI